MKTNNNKSSHDGPDINLVGTSASALADTGYVPSQATGAEALDLILEKEEDFDEEDGENQIESWGVYVNTPEKILLGLFWDQEIAQFFIDSVKSSDMMEKIKKEIQN